MIIYTQPYTVWTLYIANTLTGIYMQGHNKVFTTDQAIINPDNYIELANDKFFNAYMACLSIAVSCSKSIKPTNHFCTLFISYLIFG